jgi:putative FmdB family regulatory protein
MPILEFICRRCAHRFSQLVGVTADARLDPCPRCGSTDLERAVSSFRRGRSEDDRMDEIADRVEAMGEPESPGEMRGFVREMGKAMDDDMADEMEEMLEADAEGEDVDE